MPTSHHRLYIFTGKGGVGKTTLAMAFTKKLESDGIKVKYNCFHQTPERTLWGKLQLPVIDLELHSSAEIYIGRKLNSKTIASWIMKTAFFKSLFQMIPGLGHMILLGHLIDELERDPELVIVLDSPASGHALTMFESSSNFKAIFRSGLIVKDIDRMQRFLMNKENLKTYVITLPTELAMSEAYELKKELEINMIENKLEAEILVNDSYLRYFEINKVDNNLLPDFLQQKIKLETEITKGVRAFPHIDENSEELVIRSLSSLCGELQ